MDNLLNTILQMLEGSEITLEIFFVTLVIALPLGMMAALGRLSKWRPLSAFMEFYIWLMRGTPLMLQLLFVYFALPMIGIRLPDIAAALLATGAGPVADALATGALLLPAVLALSAITYHLIERPFLALRGGYLS